MYKFGIYLVAACLNLAASVGSAQTNYPNRPIKFIVPFPPGAATDVIARTFAQSMSETLGQPVVVENKAGAGGIVGTEAVATSAADGYSILLITTEYVINQSLRKNLSYTTQSFAPISAMASYPVFLAASAKSGIKDLAALMTAAKAKPESIRYYSWGSGSSGHLAMQMLNDAAQVKMMHVPYKAG